MTAIKLVSYSIECDHCGAMAETSSENTLPDGWRLVEFRPSKRDRGPVQAEDLDLCPTCVANIHKPI